MEHHLARHLHDARTWPAAADRGAGEYAVAAGHSGAGYLRTMARATGAGDMLAELVRLAWTIQRGRPVDRQAVVADRYAP